MNLRLVLLVFSSHTVHKSQQTLAALPGAGNAGVDFDCISVNPDGPKRCSELQLREAAVALVVAGVHLAQGFDAWDASRSQHNPFAAAKDKRWRENELIAAGKIKKKRKVELQLSAATYVSKRTLKARAEAIDGNTREEVRTKQSGRAQAPATPTSAIVANSRHVGAEIHTPSSAARAKAVRTPRSMLPPANALRDDPGAPKLLTWHPLAGVDGNPTPSFQPSPYPPRKIAFLPFPGNVNDNEHTPGILPLSWYNMCEFMCGRVSECLGPEFKVSYSSLPLWILRVS